MVLRRELGPSPNHEIPRLCEDTDFGRRVLAGGERLRCEPSAIVYHAVSEDRIQKSLFLDWRFDYGRAEARLFENPRGHLVCSLAAWIIRWMMAVGPRKRFHHKLVVWERLAILSNCTARSEIGRPKLARRVEGVKRSSLRLNVRHFDASP